MDARVAEGGDTEPVVAPADLVGRLGASPELIHVAGAALERNARDALVLDLRGLSDATDHFLIASGDSDTHTRAIADHIVERLKEGGVRPAGVEGHRAGQWILIDYLSVIVHIFVPRVRAFYELEELWGDAPRVRVE